MKKQDLLYLTASTTTPDATIVSINLVENGVIQSIPQNADEWPYQILLDAINDGWRIIKFPEQALLLNEDTSYGLGCEYVLEKIT
mgnify:FL=1